LRLPEILGKAQSFVMRLFNFLVERQCNRASLQCEGDGEHPVCPNQVRWWMRVREFVDALVNRVSRTNAKDKNSSYERPEKPFLPISEGVFLRGRSLVKPQPQQKKDLIGRIRDRVERFSHHAGRTRDDGGHQLQDCDQRVGKERAQYGQHTTFLQLFEIVPATDYTDYTDYVNNLCNLSSGAV